MWTNDPVADYLRHDAERQKELDRLPKCYICGEPIQSEECFEINDEYVCPECLTEHHRKWVEDLIE